MVVMETYSLPRLTFCVCIMGKLKIDIFSCLNGVFVIYFYRESLVKVH